MTLFFIFENHRYENLAKQIIENFPLDNNELKSRLYFVKPCQGYLKNAYDKMWPKYRGFVKDKEDEQPRSNFKYNFILIKLIIFNF